MVSDAAAWENVYRPRWLALLFGSGDRVSRAMSFVIHGIGTMMCGERDYSPGGSFVATEWFVVAWVPIIPLCGKRISYRRDSDFATYDANDKFFIYETMGVDRKQALFTYLWLIAVIGPIIVFASFEDAFQKMSDGGELAAGAFLAVSGIAAVVPYFLRRWVKRRKMKEWERQASGLDG